ncbi:hypothetical protein ACQRVR_004822 [Enterobacter cloacae]|uniref:hypothetical protein n=1 Tax=Enterobacter TaxID=547 RepID=UPI000A54BD16|nr:MULTISPECIES: hypothetical protein [Enterobacter]
MKQKFIEWFTKNNNGCSPAMEDDRSFVHEKTQHMFEAYLAGVAEGEAKCAALAAELRAVEAIHNEAVFITDDHYEQCPAEVQKIIRSLAVMQIPAYQAFLAEVRAQGVTEYASKRGFSFQHGCIHAHFGNGDVMVGAVTFENGDAGINFAPVREKTGGVGTSYEWTKGKTAEQVDSVFIIASSNAEGLEVIRDKLNESIEELRKGVQS